MLRTRSVGLGLGLLAGLALSIGCPSASQGPRLESTTVPGGAYAIGIPAGWEQTWTEAPAGRGLSELQLSAPGEQWPGYVNITVLHFAETQRTPERYLFDHQRAASGREGDVRTGFKEIVVAGRGAKVFEEAIVRYPPAGMSGDKVPSLVRHVVVPASRGFFVLKYDAPEGSAQEYQPVFDRFVESFAPADGSQPLAQDPIGAREYEVLAALFGVRATSGPDAPQFFNDVPECRLVAGSTMAVDRPNEPGWPGEEFGALAPDLIEDYLAKNEKAWPLTDRIMVPDLVVISPEELEARLRASSQDPAAEGESVLRLRGGYVTLSRVGFNSAGDLALLRTALALPGAMRAEYLVLMKQQGRAWALAKVAMEGLIYQ